MKEAAYKAIEQYGLSPLGSAPFGGLTNLHEKLGYRLGKIYGLPYGITTSGGMYFKRRYMLNIYFNKIL